MHMGAKNVSARRRPTRGPPYHASQVLALSGLSHVPNRRIPNAALRYHTRMSINLVRTPLFEGLNPEQLGDIAGRMRVRHFAPGEVICRAGEPGNSLFLIQRGLAQVLVP